MAKTTEDFQREIAQLFCDAGEKQFLLTKFKQMLSKENDNLNSINQKLENTQKAFQQHLAKKPEEAPKLEMKEELPKEPEGSSNATPPTEAV